jgi:hypothetical protein
MDIFSSRLKLCRWGAYSIDLVSSDFLLFGPVKEALTGRRFADDDEVNEELYEWLRTQQKPLYSDASKTFVGIWAKY